jgi:hypothetical protein
MREVWTDREGAARRGARAAEDVAAKLSLPAVGAIARARLERIAGRRHGTSSGGSAPYPLSEVPGRLAFDLDGAAGGARGFARRAAMRLVRPYAVRERKLDEAVAASLYRLYLDLEAERAARRRDNRRIAQLEKRLAELMDRRG